MGHDAGHVVHGGPARITGDLDVLEAVEGHSWVPFLASASASICVYRLSEAQIVRIEVALRIEHDDGAAGLAMGLRHHRPGHPGLAGAGAGQNQHGTLGSLNGEALFGVLLLGSVTSLPDFAAMITLVNAILNFDEFVTER